MPSRGTETTLLGPPLHERLAAAAAHHAEAAEGTEEFYAASARMSRVRRHCLPAFIELAKVCEQPGSKKADVRAALERLAEALDSAGVP